jgi:hypothetical protein
MSKRIMVTPDLLLNEGSKKRWARFAEKLREKDLKNGAVRVLDEVDTRPVEPPAPEPSITLTVGYMVDPELGQYEVVIISTNGGALSVDRAIPVLADAEKQAKEWAELLGIEYSGLFETGF